MKLKNSIRLLSMWVLLWASTSVNAQENAGQTQSDTSSATYVRYEHAPGTSKWIKTQKIDGSMTKVQEQYVQVDRGFSERFKKKSSATYWYDIVPDKQANHYVIRSHTSPNTIGISSSFLFYGDFMHYNDWMKDDYKNNFEGDTFGLSDFSVGLLYARQLYAKDRHKLSLEFIPSYRQIKQSFSANSYSTHYPAIDPDGRDYERIISVTNYKEIVENYCASIPINLRYDIFALKYLSFFLAGGIDNLFIVNKYTDAGFAASYSGQYGEDIYDENGVYDFGKFPDNRIIVENDVSFRYKLYGTAMLGVQLFIGPVLSLEVAGVYNKLLYSNIPVDNTESFCLSESAGTYQSMANTMKPAAQNRLGVNVKLKINF
jgi:hypothetical protein